MRHHRGMKAYSEDLRRKVVEAVEQRGMGKSEAARSFGVSLSSVKRYVGKARQGSSLSPRKHPGPRPKIDERARRLLDERARRLLEADMENRPALTLRERCRFVEGVAGVSVSESTLSRLLRRMGFSPKEGRWVRANATSS
jgi:transposase